MISLSCFFAIAQQQAAPSGQPVQERTVEEQVASLKVHGIIYIDKEGKEHFIPEAELVYKATNIPIQAIDIVYRGERVSNVPITDIKFFFPSSNRVYLVNGFVVEKYRGWYDAALYADSIKTVTVAGYPMQKRFYVKEPVMNLIGVVLPEITYKAEEYVEAGVTKQRKVIDEEKAYQSLQDRLNELKNTSDYGFFIPLVDSSITLQQTEGAWPAMQLNVSRNAFTGQAPASQSLAEGEAPVKIAWKVNVGRVGLNLAVSGDRLLVPSGGSMEYRICFIWALNKDTGRPLWKFYGTGSPFYSVAVKDGIVYTGSEDGFLYALDLSNGALKWKFKTGGPILSTPCVVGDKVYFGSDDHYVYALKADDGSLVWKFRTGLSVRSSPLVVNGIVYVGSDDNYLYALSAKNGVLIWKFFTGGPVVSSPSWVSYPETGEIIYVGTGAGYAFAVKGGVEGGTPYWRHKAVDPVYATPVVADNLVFIGSRDHTLYALDTKLGLLRWRFKAPFPIYKAVIVVGGSGYVISDNTIYCVNANTGELLWKLSVPSTITSNPIIVDSTIYFGTEDGYIYALK